MQRVTYQQKELFSRTHRFTCTLYLLLETTQTVVSIIIYFLISFFFYRSVKRVESLFTLQRKRSELTRQQLIIRHQESIETVLYEIRVTFSTFSSYNVFLPTYLNNLTACIYQLYEAGVFYISNNMQ